MVTPYYDVKPIIPSICGEYLSFFTLFGPGPYPHLNRKPTDFAAKNFFYFLVLIYFGTGNPLILWAKTFFGLHLFLDRKRVPPRNPARGATILSNATANKLFIAEKNRLSANPETHLQFFEILNIFSASYGPKTMLKIRSVRRILKRGPETSENLRGT